MKQKLRALVEMLHQLDDELENEIVLQASCLDSDDPPCDEFTLWGVADMVEDFIERRYSNADT